MDLIRRAEAAHTRMSNVGVRQVSQPCRFSRGKGFDSARVGAYPSDLADDGSDADGHDSEGQHPGEGRAES